MNQKQLLEKLHRLYDIGWKLGEYCEQNKYLCFESVQRNNANLFEERQKLIEELMRMKQPIWTKQLENFTLTEYEKQPMTLNCCVTWTTEDEDVIHFHFGGWGMEREKITQTQCYLVCQSFLMQNTDVGIQGFARYLSSAKEIVLQSLE